MTKVFTQFTDNFSIKNGKMYENLSAVYMCKIYR
jgi:hypothetical protein